MSRQTVGLVLCVIIVVVAFMVGAERGKTWAYRHTNVETDTLYITERISVDTPPKTGETPVKTEYIPIIDRAALDSLQCVADSLLHACDLLTIRNDSLMLALEITSAHFHEDSLFDAWVSGWHPSLDSIRVYQRERLVIQHVTEYRPTKWCVGITGGVGAGKDGLTPFVGVGITYSLVSF